MIEGKDIVHRQRRYLSSGPIASGGKKRCLHRGWRRFATRAIDFPCCSSVIRESVDVLSSLGNEVAVEDEALQWAFRSRVGEKSGVLVRRWMPSVWEAAKGQCEV